MGRYTDKQQREAFHLLFLERLLRLSDPKLYVLKGGVNLRLFYQSPRYSEDMDIDVLGSIAVPTLKKNCYKILNDAAFLRSLRTYGIEGIKLSDPEKAKQTSTTQRFKLRLVNPLGEEFPTKVEFSRRQSSKAAYLLEAVLPEVVRRYRRLSFKCQHYSGDWAAVQKVHALAGRPQTQARDIFDLYMLFLSGHFDKATLTANTSSQERESAAQNLLTLSYSSYVSQVVEYLDSDAPPDLRASEAWEEMCQVVLEFLR